jgi:hypothetical protein
MCACFPSQKLIKLLLITSISTINFPLINSPLSGLVDRNVLLFIVENITEHFMVYIVKCSASFHILKRQNILENKSKEKSRWLSGVVAKICGFSFNTNHVCEWVMLVSMVHTSYLLMVISTVTFMNASNIFKVLLLFTGRLIGVWEM